MLKNVVGINLKHNQDEDQKHVLDNNFFKKGLIVSSLEIGI